MEQDYQQLPALVPSLSDAHSLTDSQWHVLTSIVETVIPSILPPDEANPHGHQQLDPAAYRAANDAIAGDHINEKDLVAEYLAESASLGGEYRDALTRFVYQSTDGEQRKKLFLILSALKY